MANNLWQERLPGNSVIFIFRFLKRLSMNRFEVFFP